MKEFTETVQSDLKDSSTRNSLQSQEKYLAPQYETLRKH